MPLRFVNDTGHGGPLVHRHALPARHSPCVTIDPVYPYFSCNFSPLPSTRVEFSPLFRVPTTETSLHR